MLLPLGVGILTGILVHEEEEAGNFYGLLQCSRKRSSFISGKNFSAALVFLTGSTFLTTLIISTGLCFLLQKERGVGLFLTAACLAVCGVLPVLAVHLWISFAFGMGASVGVGICGLLLAVLLGEHIFGRPYLVCGSVDLSGENGDVSYGLFYVFRRICAQKQKNPLYWPLH